MSFSSNHTSRGVRLPSLASVALLSSVFSLLGAACSSDAPPSSTVEPLTGSPGADPEPGSDGSGSDGSGSDRSGGDGSGSTGSDGTVSGLVGLVDGETGEDPGCGDRFAPATARPPVIQLVVDTSGSMGWVAGTERAPRSGEQSKWQITQSAIASAIAAMPDNVAVGLTYYPNVSGGAACFLPEVAAPIAPLSAEQRAQIDAVNAAQTPGGGTPTHGAYAFGVEQLRATALEGPRFLLLITDGIPTYTRECEGNGRNRVDGAPLIAEVGSSFDQAQIRTFVIGSPGSEPARDELSQMATVGGTANPGCANAGPSFCHFDMTEQPDFSSALNATLAQITQATLACDYAVPTPPGGLRLDLDDASVVLESAGAQLREFERASSDACDEGWQYGENQSSIRLCRSTCDELQGLLRGDPGIGVRIKFRCSLNPY
ncbi:MAG TPA: vWA domain-containing protein [Polyangiaceae bacterium]|nr:vWA domain-containing protein [Polyangiaceae bacterium]